MITLFRICDRRYEPADPTGAMKYPGRWNDFGQPVLYFSSSLALAVLEQRARGVAFETIRDAFHYCQIDVEPAAAAHEEAPASLYTHDWVVQSGRTRAFGAAWHRKGEAIFLKVRSAPLPVEMNYVLNAEHPWYKTIRFSKAKAIPLDWRL
jgi:RES domain-containing protein